MDRKLEGVLEFDRDVKCNSQALDRAFWVSQEVNVIVWWSPPKSPFVKIAPTEMGFWNG